MKKLMIGLVAAALLPMSIQAKTVCLSTFGGAGQLKLVGVTPLKKPGSVSLIKGVYREGSLVGPITGTAVTKADGSVVLGYTWQVMGAAFGADIYFGATFPDDTLVGTLSYAYMGDSSVSSSTTTSVLSCKDFTIAP